MVIFDNVQKHVGDEYKQDESNVEIKMDLWLQTVSVLHSPNLLPHNLVIRKRAPHKLTLTQQTHTVDILVNLVSATNYVAVEQEQDL